MNQRAKERHELIGSGPASSAELGESSGIAQRLEPPLGKVAVVAGNLRIDVAGATVRDWLAAEQIKCVLLKGRGIAQRLYDHGWERPYSDCDLLIRLEDRTRAERVIVDHGYRRIDRDAARLGAAGYAHTFASANGDLLDLHWNLSGVFALPCDTWAALSERTVSLMVGGRAASVPNDEATALIVTLHNAHHGARWSHTEADLQRAIARLESDVWRAAAKLADRLDAGDAFTAGLRLCRSGWALAERLGVSDPISLEYQLRAAETSYGAWALHRIASAGSSRRRARVALQVMLPSPERMRQFFPLARRGPVGLGAAYFLRPFRLAATGIPTLLEYRNARRVASREHA